MTDLDDDTPPPGFTIPPRDDWQEAIRDDIVRGLHDWFDGDEDGFRLRDDVHAAGSLRNDGFEAVVWRYVATPRPSSWGRAGGTPVEIHGVTIVERAADGGPRFSRYIDWREVYAQMGIAAAARPVRVDTA